MELVPYYVNFASCSHRRAGISKVVLHWFYEKQEHKHPYVTINGVVSPWIWRIPSLAGRAPNQYSTELTYEAITTNGLDYQLKRFEQWVIEKYAEDPNMT